MRRTAPPPYGSPATRLHAGRILLVLFVCAALAVGVVAWLLYGHRGKPAAVATETSTTPGWTAAQLHYEKPEAKVETPPAKPIDMTAAELAKLRAMLANMQAEIDGLKNRKTPATTVVQRPARPAPSPMLFVSHEIKEGPSKPTTSEYTLAPGATKLPCVVETAMNSDVPGYFTCRTSVNVYDTATGKHLLVPQGSTILGHDNSQTLIYGNERMDTVSLTLSLPDGRSVDLGRAPVTDAEGVAGLTGAVDRHFWRLLGAVFIGGALKGGMTAMQVAVSDAAGVGQVAAGIGTLGNQATSRVLQPYIDTRFTIRVFSGQLANVLLIKSLSLPAMWQ